MNKVLIATSNQGKIKELKRILNEYTTNNHIDLTILTFNDFPKISEPIENGTTFEENAIIKTKYYFNAFKLPVICDDSGLEVYALDKKPGIYSARYASIDGKDASSLENRKKLLRELKGITKREARFCCAMAYFDGNNLLTALGYTEGRILEEEIGTNGFGYDPIFYSTEAQKPMGLIDDYSKDLISHRGKAFRKLIALLMPIEKNAKEDNK